MLQHKTADAGPRRLAVVDLGGRLPAYEAIARAVDGFWFPTAVLPGDGGERWHA